MTIAIANLRYVEATNTLIDMDVTIDGTVMPFTYHPDDREPVSLAVKDLLNAGRYAIAPYEAPTLSSGRGSSVVA